MTTNRLAIINGLRTPIGRAGGMFKSIQADDLGALIVKEVMDRSVIHPLDITDVFIGNVSQPGHAANIARVIALKAGIDQQIPAATVHRNCASGMESISQAANTIFSGKSSICLVGGVESMSNIPLLFNKHMTQFFEHLSRAKTMSATLKTLVQFRPRFLKPIIGVMQGLTDPVSNLIMGLTAENLAREFHISRDQQDQYALESHQKAAAATNRLAEEIYPIGLHPTYDSIFHKDECVRESQSLAALQKLRPYFDRKNGTVTVGNACPINDGACAMIVMSEQEAKRRKLTPIGFIRDYAYAGLEPERMGLGPVYATAKLLHQTKLRMTDFDLIEINEAFAAQVLACETAFGSAAFARSHLNASQALGVIDRDRLNVNGGAIALGHPVGMTGSRIILTLINELRRRQRVRGLASLCIGGGQGGAFVVEVE